MKKFALMGTTALLGTMTAAERSTGRYMRTPDGHDDAEFAAFEKGGSVEVGDSNKAPGDAEAGEAEQPVAPKKAPKAKVAETPAVETNIPDDADEGGEGDGDGDAGEGDEGEGEGEEAPKPKPQTASDRIRDLNRRLRVAERALAASQNGGLPSQNTGANSTPAIGEAPDPRDAEKYPLGHLDDRYIEDQIQYGIRKGIADEFAADRQRQAGEINAARQLETQAALLKTVDDLSERGSELYDDYQETVVEAGMRGEYDLSQTTFEAAAEVPNGAQILYELSQNKAEATRVSKLSHIGQLKFVQERDAAIGTKRAASKKPKAGEPPQTRTRGANSTPANNPATDDLNDFERQWANEERAN